MESKCPKCGEPLKKTDGIVTYKCGSWHNVVMKKLERSIRCYKTELINIRKAFFRAMEFVHFIADNAVKEWKEEGFKRTPVCRYCHKAPCDPSCVVEEAQKFIQELGT
jgi:hypothetical protein